jgi:hypothetical protein
VVKFYAMKDQIDDYIKIYEYMDMLEINPKALIGLLFGTVSKPTLDFIKTGKFRLPKTIALIEETIFSFSKFRDFIIEKRISPRSMFSSFHFTVAYRNLILMTEYRENIFFSKLDNRWFELKPQINSKEWTKLLISVYNWKNQNPIYDGA